MQGININSPRQFREKMYGRLPTLEEYRIYLAQKLIEATSFDSGCDFDMALARLQEYVASWPPILNENGGL